MVGAITSNVLIAGIYGAGTVRAARPTSGSAGRGLAGESDTGGGRLPPISDLVEISPAGRQAAIDAQREQYDEAAQETARGGPESHISRAPDTAEISRGLRAALTVKEQEKVRDLEQRDRQVRAHEEAHKRAGGQYVTGGPSFEYETGPDGQRYAIGGEVQIDSSPVQGDLEATIRKMQQVRRAALAPADPSEQDRRVAAQAMGAEQQARAELARQRGPGSAPTTDSPSTVAGSAGTAAGEESRSNKAAPTAGPVAIAAYASRAASPTSSATTASGFVTPAAPGLILDLAV